MRRRPLPSFLRRALLALGLLLALGGVLLLAAHAALRSEAVRTRVLAQVRPRLEARLGPVTLGPRVHLGWRGQVRLGPLEVPASRPGLPPVLHVEQLGAAVRLSALARGRLEVKRVELSDVKVEAGEEGRELRALLSRLRTPQRERVPAAPGSTGAAPPLPRLVFDGLQLAVDHGGQRYAVGPLAGQVQLEREADAQRVEAQLQLPGGGEARLTLAREGEALPTGSLELKDAQLAPLLAGVPQAAPLTGGKVQLQLALEAGAARFEGSVSELVLQHPRLAEGPVGPLRLSAEGQVAFSLARRHLRLQALQLAVGEKGEARATLEGEAGFGREGQLALQARVAQLPYQAAVDALPEAFRPGPEVARLAGEFGAQLQLQGPVWQREAWRLTGRLNLSGLKQAEGARGGTLDLRRPFSYRPLTAEGRGRELHVGPANPDFVPLAEVPPLLVRAVLLSEDSMFYSHRGFDFEALGGNLFAAEEEGGVVRGGSTIPQQLAKNLFLSREKTYARKVREAFLTLALEASLSKARELEIYLNIIEWGPGLYGLGEAARHYFGKDARTLDVKELAFLATIIPNPVRYHGYCTRGALTEVWEQRVNELLLKMHDAGDLTPEQLAEAQRTPLHFTHGGTRAPLVPVFLPLPSGPG